MKSRLNAFLGLLLALGLVAAACQPAQQAPEVEKGGVLNIELSEPGSLDPPHADDSEEIVIVRGVFEGLVVYDEKTAQAEPGVATKWEANDDATVWTFTLRRDAKFSNGEPVTAESFVRGWTRATAQAEESTIAYHLAFIEGYTEHNEQGAPTLSGVRAKDQYTLEVTMTPDPDFAIKTGHSVFMPVPSDATIAGQKPSWAENPIGNGPWQLKQPEPWKHNQEVRLVPNPNYSGDREVFLDEVVFKILADFDTAYLEWQAGNLDFTRLPPPKTAEAQAANADNFIATTTTGFDYLNVSVTKPPFNNKKFLQAVSLAIDRDGINQAIFNNTRIAATGIIPVGMPGHRKEGACKYCKLDVARAKQLFQESGVAAGTKIQLHFNAGAGHEQWVQAVADNLRTNLGVESELVPRQPFSEYLSFLRSEADVGLGRLGWGMDYPTPWNFLYPLFHTESIGGDNYARYSNPEFDRLVTTEAAAAADAAGRIKVYQQAEDIVLEDLPAIPLWFRRTTRLAKLDKFGGLDLDLFGDPTYVSAHLKGAT